MIQSQKSLEPDQRQIHRKLAHVQSQYSVWSQPQATDTKSVGGLPRLCNWAALFKSKEKAGEDEHGDDDHKHDDPQLLPGLVQCVKETLQANKMTDHLENAKDPHHSDLRWNLSESVLLTRRIIVPALLMIFMSCKPGAEDVMET